MLLQRKLEDGLNGYRVPAVPRASRSARGKGLIRKNYERFDVLASVAGNLLNVRDADDSSNSVENMVKREDRDEDRCLKMDSAEWVDSKSQIHGGEKQAFLNVDTDHHRAWKLFGDRVDGKVEVEFPNVKSCLEDPMEHDKVFLAQDSSNCDVKTTLFRNYSAFGLSSGNSASVEFIPRDVDKSSFGHQRTKTPSAPRRWRLAPNSERDGYFRTDKNMKPSYHARPGCDLESSQKIYPFKKRKFVYQCLSPTHDGVFWSEDNLTNDIRSNRGDRKEASGTSSSVSGQRPSPDSTIPNVKLSIKSFKVPELFIDIPATATIGSLKTTVMEALNDILGDGLHVGILIQGKKVRDDSKTLLQTGISRGVKQQNLGFTLEPRLSQTRQSVPTSLTKCPSCVPLRQTGCKTPLMPKPRNPSSSSPFCQEIDKGLLVNKPCAVPKHTDLFSDSALPDSQALVVAPPMSAEALAMVPVHHKSRHAGFGQRRIRRPFSVLEVEALVQAVEKLGTGRWREVKLRAFDCSNHRTYVDLKDKWKTLVHTARISPQQRRGEPVPQHLLDRVLAAHAYWSQQLAKADDKE